VDFSISAVDFDIQQSWAVYFDFNFNVNINILSGGFHVYNKFSY